MRIGALDAMKELGRKGKELLDDIADGTKSTVEGSAELVQRLTGLVGDIQEMGDSLELEAKQVLDNVEEITDDLKVIVADFRAGGEVEFTRTPYGGRPETYRFRRIP